MTELYEVELAFTIRIDLWFRNSLQTLKKKNVKQRNYPLVCLNQKWRLLPWAIIIVFGRYFRSAMPFLTEGV
jgi:hypothetical protein